MFKLIYCINKTVIKWKRCECSLNSIRLKLNTASELIVFSMNAWESECSKFYKSENICDNQERNPL